MAIERNYYIVRQPEGTTLSFAYQNGKGIVYRNLKHSEWSKHKVVIRECTGSFAAAQTENGIIYLVYEDREGNIILSRHNDKEGFKLMIFDNERKEEYGSCLGITIVNSKIHIVYSIKNYSKGCTMLYHQQVDEDMNPLTLNIIGSINYDYTNPYLLHTTTEGKLYILYQRCKDNHSLGYKVLAAGGDIWSRFYEVDRSPNAFKDYSLLEYNNGIYITFIKKEESRDLLVCSFRENTKLQQAVIDEREDIESCSLFRAGEQLWCTWITEGKFYSTITLIEHFDFSKKFFEDMLKDYDLVKASFIVAGDKELNDIQFDEVYLYRDKKLRYINVFNIYEEYRPQVHYASYIQNYLTDLCKKLTTEIILSRSVAGESIDVDRKFTEKMEEFNEYKCELNEAISVLQRKLEERERRIEELQQVILEKDNLLERYVAKSDCNPVCSEVEVEAVQLENEVITTGHEDFSENKIEQ